MISALFIRVDSVYKTLGIDCWDERRNALNWPGGNVGIYHPPCRTWGRLRGLSVGNGCEKLLAVWAVAQVRAFGGVLEHPADSSLWPYCRLPKGLSRDVYGGFTLSVDQHWFGHKAEKRTFLYIVGCEPRSLPAYPLSLDAVTHVISQTKRSRYQGKRELSKSARERTPPEMAHWLINVCKQIERNEKI